MSHDATASRGRASRRLLGALLGSVVLAAVPAATASAQLPTTNDPRFGLTPGLENAGTASLGITHLANRPKPAGLTNTNSDAAFQGNYAFVGNYNGIDDLRHLQSDQPGAADRAVLPRRPERRVGLEATCCSSRSSRPRRAVSTARRTRRRRCFRGIRIFDISNISAPLQVAAVADLPRLAHAHAGAPEDRSGQRLHLRTRARRPSAQAPSSPAATATTPSPRRARTRRSGRSTSSRSRWPRRRTPRSSAVRACSPARTAAWTACRTRRRRRRIRPACRTTRRAPTSEPLVAASHDACHDITVYEALDLAAGACEGNGILIDISDPAKPKRIDAVADPLFSYWHGATFSNDGKAVVFTDEWGGGTGARCRATDQLNWGANGIYEIVNRKLVFKSYYKLPVAQTHDRELRQPRRQPDPGPGPQHPGPGLVPGRRVA